MLVDRPPVARIVDGRCKERGGERERERERDKLSKRERTTGARRSSWRAVVNGEGKVGSGGKREGGRKKRKKDTKLLGHLAGSETPV